jgi:uncharacterized protein YjbI with pentapeptide repeats
MRTITQQELTEILELHKKWLNNESGGVRADLSYSDLSGSDLRDSNLRYSNLRNSNLRNSDLRDSNLRYSDLSYSDLSNSNLRGSDLINSDLRGSDLSGSNLRNSDLRGSDLSNSDLRDSNLRYSDLSYSDLSNSNLRGSDLSGSNLRNSDLRGSDLSNSDLNRANLTNIKINENTTGLTNLCPDGSFVAWKKLRGGVIAKLLIPEHAKRSNATTLKCRSSEAKVLQILEKENDTWIEIEKGVSQHDSEFIYEVGKIVKVDNFDEDRWNECSTGIHFFIDRRIAEKY